MNTFEGILPDDDPLHRPTPPETRLQMLQSHLDSIGVSRLDGWPSASGNGDETSVKHNLFILKHLQKALGRKKWPALTM